MREVCIIAVVVAVFAFPVGAQEAKQVVGWVENALILPEQMLVPARLDTGVEHVSLAAENVKEFSKNGKRWVRFVIVQPDGTRSFLEREVIRSLKPKVSEGSVSEQPTVMLGICLASQFSEIEVTLVNGGRTQHPLVLGRDYLAGRLVVDPSEEFTTEPECMEGLRSTYRETLPRWSSLVPLFVSK